MIKSKARFGWEQKTDQLSMIRDILEHEDYKNITGVHKVLDEYLTQQEKQAREEDEKLKAEEAEVASQENTIKMHKTKSCNMWCVRPFFFLNLLDY